MSAPSSRRLSIVAGQEQVAESQRERGARGALPWGAGAQPAWRRADDGPVPGHTLHLDWTTCDGHGLCAELLPELLERDQWGYPVAHSGVSTRDIPVSERLLPYARRAVEVCPRLALRLQPPAQPSAG